MQLTTAVSSQPAGADAFTLHFVVAYCHVDFKITTCTMPKHLSSFLVSCSHTFPLLVNITLNF